jgi:hypothetical protein
MMLAFQASAWNNNRGADHSLHPGVRSGLASLACGPLRYSPIMSSPSKELALHLQDQVGNIVIHRDVVCSNILNGP